MPTSDDPRVSRPGDPDRVPGGAAPPLQPGDPGYQQDSVTVQMNGTAAQLLVKLMADMGAQDPMAVLTRALGTLDQALAARRQGRRMGVYDPESGRFIDLVL